MSKARAWLEIMRISNAPTVLSNAIAGAVLGAITVDFSSTVLPVDSRWIVVLAPLLCYLGGMILNDAFDADIDAQERPSRPIPSGRISRRSAFVAGGTLLLAGIGCAVASGSMLATASAVLLAVIVLAYDVIHAVTAASIVLLAICRALAAFIPMTVFAPDLESIASSGILVHPAALAGWTLLLSVLARGEAAPAGGDYPPCPTCGHSMMPPAEICTECGRRPNPSITAVRSLQRRLLSGVLHCAIVAAIFGACTALLPRAPLMVKDFHDPSAFLIAVLMGMVLAIILTRGASRHADGRMRTPTFVGSLIAALALIDAIAITLVDQPLAWACTACFVATCALQRRIAGS